MNKKILLIMGISIILTGCSSSISQEDYDAKVSELETFQEKYNTAEAKLKNVQKELTKSKNENTDKDIQEI